MHNTIVGTFIVIAYFILHFLKVSVQTRLERGPGQIGLRGIPRHCTIRGFERDA